MALSDGVELRGPTEGRGPQILAPAALAFVAKLQREFGVRRLALLQARQERQGRSTPACCRSSRPKPSRSEMVIGRSPPPRRTYRIGVSRSQGRSSARW